MSSFPASKGTGAGQAPIVNSNVRECVSPQALGQLLDGVVAEQMLATTRGWLAREGV